MAKAAANMAQVTALLEYCDQLHAELEAEHAE